MGRHWEVGTVGYSTNMSLFLLLVHGPEEFVCVTGKDVAQARAHGGRCSQPPGQKGQSNQIQIQNNTQGS